MLSTIKLNFSYSSVKAITDVSMTFKPKQITCIMGRNGVGKTTLIRNVIGLLQTDSGQIVLDGRMITHLPASKRAKLGLGYVPQGRMIFPKLTVEENLKIGLEARTDGRTNIPDEVFDLFPLLKNFLVRKGGDLSGGQQQQLAVARAMVGDPKILILDEPTEGIQPNIIQRIGEVLTQLVTDRGMTVVLVEQYVDFVRNFGHCFYIMNRGQVVTEGSATDLTADLVHQHLSI